MKFYRTFGAELLLGLLLIALAGVSLAQGTEPEQATPVGTAITYQGRLAKSGQPVNAACAMTFRLYDHETAGSQIGPALDQNVTVADGLFTVSLDFGADVFDGRARWLEIAVQCPGDAGPTTLPRVALNAAPYAHYALAAPWEGIQNMPPDFADGVDNDTQYQAGWGLRQQGTAFSVDARLVQSRVAASCNGSEAIRQIDENGSVTCESLQAPLTAVDPLALNNDVLSLNQGAGSGLDADTLDARDSSEFLILAQSQTVRGSPTFSNTVPFQVTHDTLIPNLNAGQLGGRTAEQYFRLDAGETVTVSSDVTFDSAPTFGASPPFAVGSPAKVADLNTDLLDGLDSTDYFQLDKNGQVVSGTTTFAGGLTFDSRPVFGSSGAPFTVVSTQTVAGLDADTLDGQDSSEFLTSANLTDYFNLTQDETVAGNTTFNGTATFNNDVTFDSAAQVTFNGPVDFQVLAGDPPFTVNSSVLVPSLHADQAETADTAADATMLGGQLPSYYQNADNINAGTLSTDRYSAHADLSAEGYLGNASGDLAQNNGLRQVNLNADLLDGQHGAYYAHINYNGTTYQVDTYGSTSLPADTQMIDASDSICFLTLVEAQELSAGHATCWIDQLDASGQSSSYWWLHAGESSSADDAKCEARCITW